MSPARRLQIALAVLTVAGCALGPTPARFGPPTPQPLPTVQVVVFVDSSLHNAFREAAMTFFGCCHVGLWASSDSSSTLATRIERGDAADVFLAADAVHPQRLFEAGRTTGPPVPFAVNRLAIVVPASNPAGIRSLADLARPGVRIVTAADHDPISSYASQAIDRFSRLQEAPAGFVAAYATNVRSTEKDARAVLSKLEFGEADAAIGYATDASLSTFVTVIEIPEGANVRATYAGVVVNGSLNGSYGERLLLRLVGPDGQAILARNGFLPPE